MNDESTSGPSLGRDLGEFLIVLRRRWFLITLCTLLAIGAGVAYILFTPKAYAARAAVQVEQQQRAVVSVADAAHEDLKAVDALKTIEQGLSSDTLLLRVVRKNRLDQDPTFLAELGDAPPLDVALIRTMASRVKVALRRGSRIIDVTVEAADPVVARDLCQSLVDEYTALCFEQKLEAARPANQYLVKEADRLREKLDKSEQALQAYKEQQGAVSLENSQNIVVETLKDLNLKLGAARAERLKLETDVAQLDKLAGRPADLLNIASIAASPDVQSIRQRLAAQVAVLAEISGRYKPDHPKTQEAQRAKTDLEAALHQAALASAAGVKASFESAQATEDKLVLALKAQEKEALDLNKKSIQYNALAREVESDRALYETVFTQLKQAQVVEGIEQGTIRVVEPALIPDRTSKPKKTIPLALSLFVGLVSGVGLSLVLALINGPVLTVAQGERVLGLPSLGAIPRSRNWRTRDELMLIRRPRSPAAEAFRSLRASLTLRVKADGARSFLFTSALPGEGKTFCAANFAASLALDGQKTLLIDADLRKPGVARYFCPGKMPPGLAEVLAGTHVLEEQIQTTEVENLSVLTAGKPTLRAPELLGRDAMRTLLETALQKFDRIVVDTAPVLPVNDTLLIVEHVHALCLVVKAGKTPSRTVLRARQMITSAAGRSPAGFVLDQVSQGPDSYAAYGV